MKAVTKHGARELAVQHEESYPFEENIINISRSATTKHTLVTWQFPNHEFVQLLFHAPENAEIFSVSPALVLPEEGEDGQFFTKGEIKLYLSRIKAYN